MVSRTAPAPISVHMVHDLLSIASPIEELIADRMHTKPKTQIKRCDIKTLLEIDILILPATVCLYGLQP